MLITTQFPIQVLELRPTKQAQKAEELDIITSDNFDISTQDFESAFVFNAFSPSRSNSEFGSVQVKARIYDPQSPTSPRSSWSLESREFSRTSSVDMISPVSVRSVICSSRHSPASSVSSVDLDFGSVAKPAAPSTSDLTGSVVQTVSRSRTLRGSRRHTHSVRAAPNSSNDGTPGTEAKDFASETRPSSSSSSQRYFSAPQFEPRHHRRSIINSPWTCLEDAHHPLCTGSCDQGVFSSSSSPSGSSTASRSGSVSAPKWSTSTWTQCPPVPPRDPRRRTTSSLRMV